MGEACPKITKICPTSDKYNRAVTITNACILPMLFPDIQLTGMRLVTRSPLILASQHLGSEFHMYTGIKKEIRNDKKLSTYVCSLIMTLPQESM